MTPMRKLTKTYIMTIALWTFAALQAGAQSVRLYVVDQMTGDSIPYASAKYKGTQVASAGNEFGMVEIVRKDGMTLSVSAVGYKQRSVKITTKTDSVVKVRLIADSKRMEEVVVKAKRKRKYTRKNNPAVELMRKVIAAKSKTDLQNHDYYSFDKYQKVTMGVNNITPEEMEGKLFRNNPWMRDQVETCQYNNKLILPFSVDETLTRHIYRKDPKDKKEIVQGQTSKGVTKLIQTGEILNTVTKDLFKDIDLYDDQIEILQSRFPSPIGDAAISFYHFYIDDTLNVDGDRCIRMQFMPANLQDFGFRGELYVVDDSTLHVKRCDMQLPANTGVNFVDAMKIEQAYTRLNNGEWVLTTDNMVAELELTDLFQRAIVIRTTRMSNYSFNKIPATDFKGRAERKFDANAKIRDDDFWNEHRMTSLTKSEAGIDDFVENMSQTKHFKWIMLAIRVFAENFLETGSKNKPSKFDIGPLNTVVSKNFVDGIRMRLSGRTTAKFNPHWFWEGYYAYGTDSKKHYYGTKVTYSFNKPEYQPLEFPIRSVSFESTYDVMSPSDKFLVHNKDNVFMAIKPNKVENMYFFNRQSLKYKWETDYGLSTDIEIKRESNQPTGGKYVFRKLDTGDIVQKIRMTEVTLGFDYRPGQSYINTKQQRLEVNLDAPQFTIKHTFGINHLMGGQYNYNYTEVSAYKRFWMGSWGHIDTRLKAGAQWNKVPFPLLIMPPVNTSFFEHQGSFNMMEDLEFLNDRFAQFNLAWDLNGKILNRIPLVRKLKWREYLAIKGMWGHLTSKNDPTIARNAADSELFQLPEASHVMNSEPYMELVVGVHHIFKCLEVDYVRRLTYTAYPGVDVNGIRFGFNIVF